MVTLFTRREARAAGITDRRLERAVERGKYIRVAQGVYFNGNRQPLPFEVSLARAMRTGRPIRGELAAALYGMDGFEIPPDGNYANIERVNAHDALIAIAATVNDLRWEQALEWALRKGHTTVAAVEASLSTQRRGNGCIGRVMKLRPDGAPSTGSLLETYAVQLIRREPALPTPDRQVEVLRAHGQRPAYVDLAWPRDGVFLELDGEQHKDQPRYDATRQTAVIADTGWLVGRFTWTDIVYQPNSTLRSVGKLLIAAGSKGTSARHDSWHGSK